MIPPLLTARYALTGLKIALVALVLLFAVVGCTTQTVRLEGFQVRLPLIGTIGPKGWKPYALELKAEVKTIRIDLELANARHAATKRAYAEAQAEAARMQAEVVAREVARQERITDEVRADYQQRLAALRARAARLQAEARAGAGSAPGDLQLPETGQASGGADAAPRCHGLSGTRDPLTQIECDRIATEQATQLDALITWVQRQIGE